MGNYQINFPTPAGSANGVNIAGQVVGLSFVPDRELKQSVATWWLAPYYETDVVEITTGSLTSYFSRVNSNGYAVGWFDDTNVIAYKLGSGSESDIAVTAPTQIGGIGADINDENQILLQDGSIYQINPNNTASLTFPPSELPPHTVCRGMNNNGDIVGDMGGQAFVFNPAGGGIEVLAGACSLFDINDNRLAVGYTVGSGPTLPIYVDLSGPSAGWSVTSIPLPSSPTPANANDPGAWMAVNNNGVIVGSVWFSSTNPAGSYPFVYEGPSKPGAIVGSSHPAQNLNSLVVAGPNNLLDARDINDSGVIVGVSSYKGQSGYVAAPIPAKAPVNCKGLLEEIYSKIGDHRHLPGETFILWKRELRTCLSEHKITQSEYTLAVQLIDSRQP